MKKILFVLLAASLFWAVNAPHNYAAQDVATLQGTITLSGAWALYPMVVKWAEEFQKIHPQVRIDIAAGGAGKGMVDCLSKIVDLGMVSREINSEEINKGAWFVAVTKDAVVPTVNENNPVMKALLAKGISKEIFKKIWITGEFKTWGEVVGREMSQPINVYTRSDACGAAQIWAKYLDKDQEDLLGIGVYGDPGLAEAVREDVLGIGYNNINFVYDSKIRQQVDGVAVLPIDLDGNGQIDSEEDVYRTLDDIVGAIDTGRYPSPPARELYLVSAGKPEKKVVVEFLKWILTDGQRFVTEAGYINLTDSKLKEGLKKLSQD